jgi:hypothetical protein
MTSTHEQQEAPGDNQPAETRQAHEGELRRHLRHAPEAFRSRLRHAPEALWHNRRWAALSAAVVFASVAAVYLTSAGYHTSAGKSLPGSSGTRPSAGSPAAPASSTAAARPAAVGASPHLAPEMAALLTKWNSGHGAVTLAAVSGQLANTTQAGGLRFFAPMRQACLRLATTVTAAQAGPAIPDATMQRQYMAALATLAKAVTYCEAGISARPYGDEDIETHENTAMLDKALSAFAAGARELYQATAQIKALSLSHSR